jgi:hypothetical protein
MTARRLWRKANGSLRPLKEAARTSKPKHRGLFLASERSRRNGEQAKCAALYNRRCVIQPSAPSVGAGALCLMPNFSMAERAGRSPSFQLRLACTCELVRSGRKKCLCSGVRLHLQRRRDGMYQPELRLSAMTPYLTDRRNRLQLESSHGCHHVQSSLPFEAHGLECKRVVEPADKRVCAKAYQHCGTGGGASITACERSWPDARRQ